ncbi:MAG: hypothetical protein WCS59_05920 [Sphaerochaetaceae bacterium]
MKRTIIFSMLLTMVLILSGCDLFPPLLGGDENYYYVSGYVTEYNSEPTDYLKDVLYKVREGSNNRDGDPLESGNTENTTTPATRSFLSTLEPGVYTIEFSKDGYHTAYLTNLVVEDTIVDANMMMKPNDVHYAPETILDGYAYGNAASLSAYVDE